MLLKTTIDTISEKKHLLTEDELNYLRTLIKSRKKDDVIAKNFIEKINFESRENDLYWQAHEKIQNIPHESEFKSIEKAGVLSKQEFLGRI